jgi:aminoglycoside phosphotransferase (APT) family kinase protein
VAGVTGDRLYVRSVTIRNRPAAEVEIGPDLVRALLEAQHPDLAGRPLVPLASGWDNELLRLGDDLLVRLPRREIAAELVRHEQRWLPELAPRLPLPVPAPVRVGRPGSGYPWPWSVLPMFAGDIAALVRLGDPAASAHLLGRFLGALHRPAPEDYPVNPLRGVPLSARDAMTRARIAELDGSIDAPVARRRWREALDVPSWPGVPMWLHGDLHPANLLVERGELSAVLDFGDITGGDPATDLGVAWMLLPTSEHASLRDGYRASRGVAIDDDTWQRGRGWALSVSLAFLQHSADHPVMAGIAARTLERVLR